MNGKRGFIFVVLFIVLSVFVNAVPLGPEYGCCGWSVTTPMGGYGGTFSSLEADCQDTDPNDGQSYNWNTGQIGQGNLQPCLTPSECPDGDISAATGDYCICAAGTDFPGEVYKKTDGGSCFLGELDCTDGIDRDLNGLIDCSDPDCFSEDVCNPDLAVNTDYSMNICEGSTDPKYGLTYSGHYESTVSPNACCGDDVVLMDDFSSGISDWSISVISPAGCAIGETGKIRMFTDSSNGYCGINTVVNLTPLENYKVIANVEVVLGTRFTQVYSTIFCRYDINGDGVWRSADGDYYEQSVYSRNWDGVGLQRILIDFSTTSDDIHECALSFHLRAGYSNPAVRTEVLLDDVMLLSDNEYGFFDSDARYFCSKDLKSGTADDALGEIDNDIGSADWHWWDATIDPFRIHTITIG